MAVNWTSLPSGTVGFEGVTLMELNVALLTVNCTEARRAPLKALIVVVPVRLPTVTNPVCGSIVATPGSEEDQVTAFVTTRSPPGLPAPLKKTSTAVYCCVVEGAMSWSEGETRSCLGPACAAIRMEVPSISISNNFEGRGNDRNMRARSRLIRTVA